MSYDWGVVLADPAQGLGGADATVATGDWVEPARAEADTIAFLQHGRCEADRGTWVHRRKAGLTAGAGPWQSVLFDRPSVDMMDLPPWSALLQFRLTLEQPYLSRDDAPLHLMDNPLRQDGLWGVPLLPASGWKGALRAAARRMDPAADPKRVARLLGPERETEELSAGRLRCLATFFDRIGLELINPHDRARRVGTGPLRFECVPAGARGWFTALYLRRGGVARGGASDVGEDLCIMAEAVRAACRRFGFGAKTSSGFGLASEGVTGGTLSIRVPPASPSPTAAAIGERSAAAALPRYLEAPGRLRPEFRNPDGTFRARPEAELRALNKARAWWEREGRKPPQTATGRESAPPAQPMQWPRCSFDSFNGLVAAAEQVARDVARREGGDA
jgi:CRISPR-associated protein Cmr2